MNDLQLESVELDVDPDNNLALLMAGFQETTNLEARQLRERLGDTFTPKELSEWCDDEVISLAMENLLLRMALLVAEDALPKDRVYAWTKLILSEDVPNLPMWGVDNKGKPTRRVIEVSSLLKRAVWIEENRIKPREVINQDYQVAMMYLLEGGYEYGLERSAKLLHYLEADRTERCIEGITRPAGLSKLPPELKVIINHSTLDDNGEEEDIRQLSLSISMPNLKTKEGDKMFLSKSIISAVRAGIEDGSLREEIARIHRVLNEDESTDSIVYYISAVTITAPMIARRMELARLCKEEHNLAACRKHWGYIKYLKNISNKNFTVTFFPDTSNKEWVEYMNRFWTKDVRITSATPAQFKHEWYKDPANRRKAYYSRKKTTTHITNRGDYLIAMARFANKLIKAKRLACEVLEESTELAEEIRAVLDNEVIPTQ